MNSLFAPKHQQRLGDDWVLWFETSNTYSVIDSEFKELLDSYLTAGSIDTFKAQLQDASEQNEAQAIIAQLQDYLEACNAQDRLTETKTDHNVDSSKRHVYKCYNLYGKYIGIYYDSDLVLKSIHPQIAHLEIEPLMTVQSVFDLFLDGNHFILARDTRLLLAVPKREYHKIQGKFIAELLCISHDKTTADWIGTFHGSTISDSVKSILLVGASGSGKSTLSALLMSAGFDLVADDISPLLAGDQHMYSNPIALSVKKGAFDLLSGRFKDFEDVPIIRFNPNKGALKYLASQKDKARHYPCKAIIEVRYSPDSPTTLEPVPVKSILETMIPESWLSHNPEHAYQFLTWLKQQQYFKLTYSNSEEVVACMSDLFKTLN